MLKRWMICCAMALLFPVAAHAQSPVVSGFGPRVGFSVDPDQIVFGGHLVIAEIAPNLTFDPSLDFGFGDDLTVISLNLDMHYHFEIEGSNWRPYAGAGVGISFVQFDAPPFVQDDSETDVGGSVILGAGVPTQSNNRFFGELKIGLGDIPDLKLLVGWIFRM